MSIRLRLTLTYSALLALFLLLFGGIVVSVLHWVLLDSIDRTLDETVHEVLQNIQGPRLEFSLPEMEPRLRYYLADPLDLFRASSVVFVQLWDPDGILIDNSTNLGSFRDPLDPQALDAVQETRRNVTVGRTPLRVLTRPVILSGRLLGRVQVGVSLATVQEAENYVVVVMLVAGVFALSASLLVSWALLERALRPIESIAEVASQIATGDDLSRRIPYRGPPDELGQLTSVFNDTLARLEQLFNAQRRFVADVSHELRTPLTVIQGNLDIIRRYGADRDSLEAIDSESKRMTRMVGDLLLLAQADAGELPLVKQNLELDTLVLEVYEQARVLSEGRVQVALGKFEPVRVHGDPDRLKQLLLNLVSNALKYTPPEGTVTLAVWPHNGHALVSVADTGEGIPEEDLPHIFDRFYRVDKARARRQGGVGLGLSIAHWIATAHGGRITVHSRLGVGTTFTVHLPALVPPPESVVETRPVIRLPRSLRLGNGDTRD